MEIFKPNLIVSKCLGFASCRYNGQTIPDKFVEQLKPFVNFIPICAEVEIGLGVPRSPLRIVWKKNDERLVQPLENKDCTEDMREFCQRFLNDNSNVDGFILKSRSPSCGLNAVKVYLSEEIGSGVKQRTSGFFAKAVLERYSNLAIEDEARLNNFRLREHFMTKLFTLAKFRNAYRSRDINVLIDFHSQNKLLFMSYNQTGMRKLGKIIGNHQKGKTDETFQEYKNNLCIVLCKTSSIGNNINVLMHAFGYISKDLNRSEKSFFLDILEKYRERRIPLSVPQKIMHSYIIRFDQPYLKEQTFFAPYPEELVTVTDSGKGRV